jgi:hypothetical protein
MVQGKKVYSVSTVRIWRVEGCGNFSFQSSRADVCNVITCFIGRVLPMKIGTEGIYRNLL